MGLLNTRARRSGKWLGKRERASGESRQTISVRRKNMSKRRIQIRRMKKRRRKK
jgi:hypothetical protein